MAFRNLRLGALLFALSTSVAWTSGVLAQAGTVEKTTAEALFDEGVKLMKSGSFVEACPKLENSQRVDPAVGTLLYLGECYEKLGRAASAWATFREAQSSAEASGQTKRAATAKQRVAKVEKDLAYLTIDVADATKNLPGLRITRGGLDAGTSIIGAPVPVDPGDVMVEVSAPGHQNYSVTVTVQARSRQSMTVPALAVREEPKEAAPVAPAPVAPAPVAPAPVAPPPPAAAEGGGTSTLAIVGLVVAGVGVAGAGVGTFFGLRAISEDKKADQGSCGPNVCQTQTDFDHADKAVGAAKIANVAIGVGGGLIVAGGLMFLFAPSGESKREGASVRVGPRVGPGFAGIGVEGRL